MRNRRPVLHRMRALAKRPLTILVRLCAKKVYQGSMRFIRRLQTSLCLAEMGHRRFLRQFTVAFHDQNDLIRFLEKRHTPLFYWAPQNRHDLLKLINEHYPETIPATIREADNVCQHIFDLLGSGPVVLGKSIDWHQDFKSGYRWSTKFYADILQLPRGVQADVKVPRELSRCHHFVTLGKSYWYTQNETYAKEFVWQLTDWLEKNPPWMTINWCSPMDVAIRMVNWIWSYYFFSSSPHFQSDTQTAFLKSILVHAQFISENLEYYGEFSDNHYASNIVGLMFAGILFPELKRAKRWKRFALNALFTEMYMQVHNDGVQFEGSINYHGLVLEMFASALILCQRNGITVPQHIWSRLEKMFEFVLYYTKPDGLSPQIGDTDNAHLQVLAENKTLDHRYLLAIGAVLFDRGDFKEAAGSFPEDALWLLGEPGFEKFNSLQARKDSLTSRAFNNGGFYFMRHKNSYMAIHCSPNGRKGIGNHSHNDMLSFELFAYDKAFIVDPGTYTYTADPEWRNLFRSSSYHNTVTVDAAEINSIIPEKLFELRNDAFPRINLWEVTPEFDVFDAQHNGYERLLEPVTHRRQFYFEKATNYWVVKDIVTGTGQHELNWFFHFSSGINIGVKDRLTIETCCQEGANLLLQAVSDAEVNMTVEEGWISLSYGMKARGQIVRYSYLGDLPKVVRFILYPYPRDDPMACSRPGSGSQCSPKFFEPARGFPS